MLFTQLFINGLQTGALYALIAAGFSLIFGMTRIFHAAHGATFTIAGYIFYE
jgi:branched-chain amino acid transport system permease protein